MTLGITNPEWRELSDELAKLARAANGANAIVFDAWGHLWCRAFYLGELGQPAVLKDARAVLDELPVPLTKGGKLDRVRESDDCPSYWRSYAGIYVLALYFNRPISVPLVARLVTKALTRIEALTVRLPPPGGPESTAGAGKLEA
ncbi:hypothetical protein [Polyangium sp. y55x31]|uniref:hypothetical protein n=1 Tax=Polyangium sp. y55x31 TaxID=3042688 RepID=UPI0024829F7F|nr:hypothetical protein [Polyangium sp. y55x31]MDI1484462.1 hypothetical protein [Polyangium sp. y55x31]